MTKMPFIPLHRSLMFDVWFIASVITMVIKLFVCLFTWFWPVLLRKQLNLYLPKKNYIQNLLGFFPSSTQDKM